MKVHVNLEFFPLMPSILKLLDKFGKLNCLRRMRHERHWKTLLGGILYQLACNGNFIKDSSAIASHASSCLSVLDKKNFKLFVVSHTFCVQCELQNRSFYYNNSNLSTIDFQTHDQ